uniref:Secreted protein n=1 Tax=Picea glauca TaxID=3330 RepID=A0A101M2F8_PICGL|nr:hypothetical protein ABT39_MTgene3007 [Picea glauca]
MLVWVPAYAWLLVSSVCARSCVSMYVVVLSGWCSPTQSMSLAKWTSDACCAIDLLPALAHVFHCNWPFSFRAGPLQFWCPRNK